MATFVALLRAVNVGGTKLPMADLRGLLEGLGLGSVRTYLQSGNAVFDVRREADSAAGTDTAALAAGGGGVASGGSTVVGGASNGASNDATAEVNTPCGLATAIEVRIERDLGPRVGVLVVPGEAFAGIVAANPFSTGGTDSDEKSLHATFLFGSECDSDFGEASGAAYSAVYEAAFNKLSLPADEGEAAAFVGAPALAVPVVYLKLPHGYGRTKLNNAWFERKLGAAATTRNWRTVNALAAMAAGEA
jgi:uncharacterized protein (DUF1697 family)